MSRPEWEITRVTPQIYLSGYRAAALPREIQVRNITHIVKMFADDESYVGGYHRHEGVSYFVAAAKDLPDYDIRNDLVGAVKHLREGILAGGNVLVHCHMGISRSVSVVVLYLMVYHGLSADDALAYIRTGRPVANPNPGFMHHLRATGRRLRAMRAASRQGALVQ